MCDVEEANLTGRASLAPLTAGCLSGSRSVEL
jgi:hypothetical protein